MVTMRQWSSGRFLLHTGMNKSSDEARRLPQQIEPLSALRDYHHMKRYITLLAILVSLLVYACAHIAGTVPAPVPLAPSGTFSVGAAKVELTPIPGFPMAGHSIA